MHKQLFPSQTENEKILLVIREHWFRIISKLFAMGLLAIAPFLLMSFLYNYVGITFSEKTQPIISLIQQLYLLGIMIATFIVIALYYLNVHIVSEERVVDIDQVNLLNHKISELNVESVQDVTARTVGLFGSLLNYGTVYIQTAGASERFQFENIARPANVSKLILEVYEHHQAKNNQSHRV